MSERQRKIGFPLLAKELTELANRRRTYVVRFLYAAGLFAGGLIAIYGSGAEVQLGAGREIFRSLVQLQFWLILLFLPPSASGALTIEKERDSLSLLLLTTIPPWSILVQKFLSRLVPMVSFLLLSFPLLAVAYSYGGVATGELVGAIVLLLLFAAQVCAVAVMCSAYCRTTPEALIATYAALLVLFILPPAWPPHLFSMFSDSRHPTSVAVVVASVPVGAVMAGTFLMGRVFLEKRAFVPPRNVLLQIFHWLDGVFEDMNSVTGGVVLVNDKNSLPDDAPIAWRETAKKSLGTFRYLFRVCTALELPIIFVGAAVDITMVRSNNAISALLYILWWIAAAMICVHASGVITAERSRQSLDALLAVPLTGAEILNQKLAGVWRLIAVLLVPFGTIYLFQLWFRGFNFGYVLGSVATASVFLPLIAWMALAVGLRIRATMKAVLTSVGIVVAVALLPFAAATVLGLIFGGTGRLAGDLTDSLSPISIVRMVERRGQFRDRTSELEFWLTVLITLPLYGSLWWAVRRNCLRNADRLLNRVEQDAHPVATEAPHVEDSPATDASVAAVDVV